MTQATDRRVVAALQEIEAAIGRQLNDRALARLIPQLYEGRPVAAIIDAMLRRTRTWN
jgi:hypothetical protein